MALASLLPSVPYPPTKEGYWNPVTSTLNWCEEDYYATPYSAEIVNTLTNLLFIGLGIKGIRSCLKYGHDRIFLVSFMSYMLVGSGSFAFHSTLKYPMQLVDELSMIYSTCIMCYATFGYNHSLKYRIWLAIGLVSLSAFITTYYHYLQAPIFHQNAFALLTAVVLFRSIYVMEVNIRPSLRAKYATSPQRQGEPLAMSTAQREASERRDKQILKDMWLMVVLGLSIFLGGFAIWNLDNIYCSTIRRWRHQVGLPWGIVLEGHGWWHIMTGTGAYFYIVWGIWLRHCLNGKQDEYVLNWPSIFTSFPEIVPASVLDAKANGEMNQRHVNGTNGFAKADTRKTK
ncbi:alkaline phytoceramidase [Phlyctema vagabunda]|uniref:Alkaline phytoceramidase n=1 Tax=Phlyctema vagabunda TaxID=108571 RepID=A0ABR4PBR7_9HELO